MHNRPARWMRAIAAAALVALPLTVSAQTPPMQPPPTQPPTATPPDTSPMDAAGAKEHLSQARDTLSQLTAMPEAAKLQGDARTQVTQLISNFNELITTQQNWRAAYGKVDANLSTLLGPDTPEAPAPPPSGVTGAVGTSGAAASQLDPAVRTKLAEFRTHLKAFQMAAAGVAGGAMPPSVATDATANPANPAGATNPANPPAGAAPASPTPEMAPADQAKATEQVGQTDAGKHLDAIDAILKQSKTGALTKAQTAELKKHVDELRQILNQK